MRIEFELCIVFLEYQTTQVAARIRPRKGKLLEMRVQTLAIPCIFDFVNSILYSHHQKRPNSFSSTSFQLAQSPRVFAHLLKKGKIPSSAMALTVVDQPRPKDRRLPAPNPPKVATTPCGDLWPKPYFFQDGLRRVEPYHFTYNTNVKERWRGRELLDIFVSEFRDRPEEYYVCAAA